MAHQILLVALSTVLAALPPAPESAGVTAAPAAGPEARYCLRVEPLTGSRIETIECRTRDDWAALEVDVDREWAENGVRVIA